MLSGFFACGACGGGFFAVARGSVYGCGWHRDRGPEVCASGLRVPLTSLEDRIFGALRERILVPDAIAYAVERAMAETRELLVPERPDPMRAARLAEIDESFRCSHAWRSGEGAPTTSRDSSPTSTASARR